MSFRMPRGAAGRAPASLLKKRFSGRGRPRFSRRVLPSYSRRKMPRRWSSGTTRSTTSSRPGGQIGKEDVEAVGAAGLQPFLHLIGDHRGGADHGETGIAAEALGQLAHGEVVGPRHVDRLLARGLAGIGLGDLGQGAIGIEARGVMAERDGERGDGAVVMDEAVQQQALLLRLCLAVAHDDEGAGQDLQMVGVAARGRPCGPSHRRRSAGPRPGCWGRRRSPPPSRPRSGGHPPTSRPAPPRASPGWVARC